MTTSYTYAILEVSPACFEEIQKKLEAAGYAKQFNRDRRDGKLTIDMHGIALKQDADAGK